MAENVWTTTVTTGEGGLLTEEAGVLAGEVTLRTFWSPSSNTALVTVRGADSGEWYTMAGAPLSAVTAVDGEAVHVAAVDAASRGGGARVPNSN